MKKIKSVKLKNDYRSSTTFIPEGTVGKVINDKAELFTFVNFSNNNFQTLFKHEIEENKTDLFKIEYEEERKYIDVRIEYDNFNDNQIGVGDIKSSIENYSLSTHWNFKVTELSEAFSREDMIEFRKYIAEDYHCSDEQNFDYWLSERSNK